MNNSAELIIQTDQLTKHFGHIVAVDKLQLEIKKGEIFGLVGRERELTLIREREAGTLEQLLVAPLRSLRS
jgi:hypothetical protein